MDRLSRIWHRPTEDAATPKREERTSGGAGTASETEEYLTGRRHEDDHRMGTRTGLTTARNVQVMERPFLRSLKDTDVRAFVTVVQDYNRHLVSMGGVAQPLLSMIAPQARYGLEFVAERAKQDLPSHEATAAEWDTALMAIFMHILGLRQDSELTLGKAEDIVRQHVQWDVLEEDFNNALVQFVCSWNHCIDTHGLQTAFTKTAAAEKRAVTLMTALLTPLAFRQAVDTAVKWNGVKTIKGWQKTVYEKQSFYEGVQQQRAVTRPTWQTTRPAATEAAQRKVETVASEGASKKGPPTGCFHCKGAHFLSDCPTASHEEKEAWAARKQARHLKTGPATTSRPTTTGARLFTATSVLNQTEEPDGTVTFGTHDKYKVNVILDTGATHTFIGPEHARHIMEATEAELSELEEPMTIKTAGRNMELQAWHKISTNASLQDHTTGTTATMPLELIVVPGLGTEEVLLGRDTIAAMSKPQYAAVNMVTRTSTPVERASPPPARVLTVRPVPIEEAPPVDAVTSDGELEAWACMWLEQHRPLRPTPKIWADEEEEDAKHALDWLKKEAALEVNDHPWANAFITGHRQRPDSRARMRWELQIPWTPGEDPTGIRKWEDVNEVYKTHPSTVTLYVRDHIESGAYKDIVEMKSIVDSLEE